MAHLEDVTLLPISQLAHRFAELDPNRHYYLHCEVGVRSLHALQFLRQQGFKHLKSVNGGLVAWAEQIGPARPGY